MIMFDVGAAEQLGGVEISFAELAGILRGDDREYAGSRLSVFQIDGCDASLGNGRPDHIPIGLVRDDVVPLIRIGRGARGLEWSVDAVGRQADYLELVDRIERGGMFKLHGSASRFGQHRAERALD